MTPRGLTGMLPAPLTDLVGRQAEQAAVRRRLATGRMVTMVGPGGVGKTRLALAVAAAEWAERPGAWLVELATVTDPGMVAGTVATAVGLGDQPDQPACAVLIDALRAHPGLLVLDNCEHVVDACAELVAALLAGCPELVVLATSRAALRVPGELLCRVPPLGLPAPLGAPDGPVGPATVQRVAASEAAQLFVARARQFCPDFAVTELTAAPVTEVCRRLDGIPLALELAAARLRVLTVGQVAARLDDHLRLLTGGGRTAPHRQQTLRATLDWSHALLGERERVLLGQLSVFAGTFSLPAVEAVAAAGAGSAGPGSAGVGSAGAGSAAAGQVGAGSAGAGGGGSRAEPVVDVLEQLAEHSLVEVDRHGTEARYRLLEVVRQYAAEQLAGGGGTEPARRRHARHYLGLAERAEPHLRGPGQVEWLASLELDHANLRAALGWALDAGEGELALRLVGALRAFWEFRGHLREGHRWCAAALALAGEPVSVPVSASVRAKAQFAIGTLAHRLGQFGPAAEYLTGALAGWQQVGDRTGMVRALNGLGMVADARRDYPAAREHFTRCLAVLPELGDRYGIAVVRANLSNVALAQGDHATARAHLAAALAIHRAAGVRLNEAACLANLAGVARAQHDLPPARRWIAAAVRLFWEHGGHSHLPEALALAATVLVGSGAAEPAARLFGAAEAANDALGTRFSPADREQFAPDLAVARDRLGAAAFATASAAGRAMTLAEAVDLAVRATAAPTPTGEPAPAAIEGHGASARSTGTGLTSAGSTGAGSTGAGLNGAGLTGAGSTGAGLTGTGASAAGELTRREQDVVAWVARGLTNRQIAQELYISVRTVDSHVAHVLSKLGFRSRAQIAGWATQQR